MNPTLTILGSSSKGNSYIIDTLDEKLIIECGIPMSDILKGINYKASDVRACLISHAHR